MLRAEPASSSQGSGSSSQRDRSRSPARSADSVPRSILKSTKNISMRVAPVVGENRIAWGDGVGPEDEKAMLETYQCPKEVFLPSCKDVDLWGSCGKDVLCVCCQKRCPFERGCLIAGERFEVPASQFTLSEWVCFDCKEDWA
eukprot:2893045-Pyramimonas_sp.AAC.1